MKKYISVLLAVMLTIGAASQAFAEIVYEDIVGEERVSVGANLSSTQKETVYNYFGIEQGTVNEVVVTIDDERAFLEGVIDDSKIGTRSLSSIYIVLLEEGSGLYITLHNINWLTKETYQNALITVGVTDAKIIIASPVAVSGTAALTGIYKSYEDITGEEIDDAAKEVATEELVTTGELSDEIGSDEASALVNEIKLASDDIANMDDEAAKKEINKIADKLNVTLTDSQLEQLLALARSFENVDLSGVESALNDISDKFSDILDVDSGGFWSAIVNFFVGIKDWFVELFTGSDAEEDSSLFESEEMETSETGDDVSDESSYDENDSSYEDEESSEDNNDSSEESELQSVDVESNE